jgi:hypothetical protein
VWLLMRPARGAARIVDSSETPGPLPPVTVTFPTWLTITTALTGAVIWYLAVALCVPGTDRPGLALAVGVP